MKLRIVFLFLISLAFVACGDSADSGSPDGTNKVTTGKGDAWDWRNDPARFRAELNYKWADLPGEGTSNKVAWADTYWPVYEDSVNDRWQGSDVLSPAEKWDKAFNDWTEPDGFMELRPYDSTTCEWDDAYYESLGPAALWVSKNKGNWRSHNGQDDDGDGLSDAEECSQFGGDDEKDRDGVETWWGLCHAWVPASILEDEPQRAVEANGVTFEVADLKALMVLQYDKADAYMLGGRCNEAEVNRDDNGRLTQSQCRDVNAGSFHVIVTNFLGLQSRPIAEDRTYNYEVWNQPVVGYKITEQEELSVEDVNALLRTGDAPNEEATPETAEEIAAVLEVANTLNAEDLESNAGIRTEVATAIVTARAGEDGELGTADDVVFAELSELEAIFTVGPRVLAQLLTYAREQGIAPAIEDAIYSFNADATKFVRVRMTLDYITESHALKTPTSDVIARYTRQDNYEYILEIDDNDEIIGGEWVGSSITSHPDFLWLPIAARSGAPDVDLEKIRELVRESRGDEVTDRSFGSETSVAIPDNDPDGAFSEVTVDQSGVIESMTINVDIEHTYRGDLLVSLEKVGSQTVLVFDGYQSESRWEDNVVIEGDVLAGFEGVEMSGTWRLNVVDSLGSDTGSIKSWSVAVQTR